MALAPRNYDAATLKAVTLLLAGKPPQEVRKTLADIASTGGGEKGLIFALRFQTAWFARRPAEALAALVNAPEWLSASTAVGLEPASLLRAQTLAAEKQSDRAQGHATDTCLQGCRVWALLPGQPRQNLRPNRRNRTGRQTAATTPCHAGGHLPIAPLLQHDPIWDPLRREPKFQRLIQEFANKPPPPTSTFSNSM